MIMKQSNFVFFLFFHVFLCGSDFLSLSDPLLKQNSTDNLLHTYNHICSNLNEAEKNNSPWQKIQAKKDLANQCLGRVIETYNSHTDQVEIKDVEKIKNQYNGQLKRCSLFCCFSFCAEFAVNKYVDKASKIVQNRLIVLGIEVTTKNHF